MVADDIYKLAGRFMRLHSGLDIAFGTGEGRWVKRRPTVEDFCRHLLGQGPGIGIAPLRPDNTVMFAAIDLDEPDFEAAREMQDYLPGTTFVEQSRSGNAHVLVYFQSPLEAWVAIGVMKEATLAAGKKHVEVFPKNHDFSRVKLGSYINLSYHGDKRRVMNSAAGPAFYDLPAFVYAAESSLNDPERWRKHAQWLLISPPERGESNARFGEQANLHICGEHIIANADTHPVLEGSRNAVYFALAKQLTNWREVDHDEALMLMRSVNEASPDRIDDAELRRILGNAERGQFTSTGCDDPLFAPYRHPDCKIGD